MSCVRYCEARLVYAAHFCLPERCCTWCADCRLDSFTEGLDVFAGGERCARVSKRVLNPSCVRVRATEHALRDPNRVLERRHGLAEIAERRAGVRVERLPVAPPHPEREFIILPENTSRHG